MSFHDEQEKRTKSHKTAERRGSCRPWKQRIRLPRVSRFLPEQSAHLRLKVITCFSAAENTRMEAASRGFSLETLTLQSIRPVSPGGGSSAATGRGGHAEEKDIASISVAKSQPYQRCNSCSDPPRVTGRPRSSSLFLCYIFFLVIFFFMSPDAGKEGERLCARRARMCVHVSAFQRFLSALSTQVVCHDTGGATGPVTQRVLAGSPPCTPHPYPAHTRNQHASPLLCKHSRVWN